MRVVFARLASMALLATLLLSVSSAASGQRTQPANRITAIKVSTIIPRPPDGEMDSFDDLLANRTGNEAVLVDRGTANFPVRYLLVMVDVTGNTTGSMVELTGRERRRVIYRKISEAYVGPGETRHEPFKTFALFFIEGVRCDTLRLTARLMNERPTSTMTKTLEFPCGE